MTAIVILLVLILLCMFKTVRVLIGLLVILVWWNWPADKPAQTTVEPPPAVIEQTVVPEPSPPRPEPAPSLSRKPRPYIQQ
jgi:hypothetical protein